MNNKDELRTKIFNEIKEINIINLLKDKDDNCLDIFDFRCHYCPLAFRYFNNCATNGSGCYLMRLARLYYEQKHLVHLVNMPNQNDDNKKIEEKISNQLVKSRKSQKRKAFLYFQLSKYSMNINNADDCYNGNRFFDDRCYECPILTGYRAYLTKLKKAEIDKKIRDVNDRLTLIELSFKRNLINKETYEQRVQIRKNEITKLEKEKNSIKTTRGKDKWLINFQISQDRQWLQRKAEYDSKQNDRKEM